jgi:hypothetical protein
MGNKIWLILNREDDYHDLRSCLVREMGILLGKLIIIVRNEEK